jgi:hypothetical protein
MRRADIPDAMRLRLAQCLDPFPNRFLIQPDKAMEFAQRDRHLGFPVTTQCLNYYKRQATFCAAQSSLHQMIQDIVPYFEGFSTPVLQTCHLGSPLRPTWTHASPATVYSEGAAECTSFRRSGERVISQPYLVSMVTFVLPI